MTLPVNAAEFDGFDEFATVRQLEYLESIRQHGSVRAAAASMGLNESSIRTSMKYLKMTAARLNVAPSFSSVRREEPGFEVKGRSTYYDKTGTPSSEWVKTTRQMELQKSMMREAMQAMVDDMPAIDVAPAPLNWQDDVIPWIQIGDAHLGMLAHANEVGENFDLKIAEIELCTAISMLIDELPSCGRIVINDLGDFTHYENMAGVTEASGHALDLDGRFPKMIRVYVRVMRFIVEKALEKAAQVDVIVNQGNHSRTNDVWMVELLRAAYGHTSRVNILNNDNVFIGYRMGNTLVMTHHSDKCKPARLANVMMADFRKDYGETEFHYIDIGHVHHAMVLKEHPNVFVESFNHLAAYDRWAHDSGYRNRKSITIVLRSKRFGEVGRRVLPIQEVRDRLVTVVGHPVVLNRVAYTV